MPNWIEGSLKLRGSINDILNFVENGLESYEYKANDKNVLEPALMPKEKWLDKTFFDEKDPGGSIIEFNVGSNWIYIKDTRRAFVDDDLYHAVHFHKTQTNGIYIAVMAVKQAWGFDESDWLEIAKKYNLDLKLYGIEGGMGFWQKIDIIGGQIATDGSDDGDPKDYSSFAWQCPFPWMGG